VAKGVSRWDSGIVAGLISYLPKHPESRSPRYDFLSNDFLGYGTSRDKLSFGQFVSSCKLSDGELDALYYSDDVASRICNLQPAEMLRAGYTLVAKDQTAARELQLQGRALGLDLAFLRAMQWGRLRGGAVCMIGALDGVQDLSLPLDIARVREVRYLNVVDRRFVTAFSWQDDPFRPGCGMPDVYSVGSLGATAALVHASRLIRFDGVQETDPVTRRALGGWTYSCLQRAYDVLRKFATAYESAAQLIADAAQGVWKIENLLDAIANNRDELLARMQLADMTRSAGRAIMVDAATEDFTRVTTPMGGVSDILNHFQQRLAAAAEMPVTLLMGRSPAGQNATGDSDFRAWYGGVKSSQTNDLKPKLLEVYRILAKGKPPEGLDIEFHPLWEQTAEEQARTENMRAQTDKIYTIDIGAVGPEQVAIARFGSGKGQIQINEAFLLNSIKVEEKFAGDLEEARKGLSEKDMAALSIAQGVSPIIVSSLINAGGKQEGPAAPGAPTEEDDDAEPEEKPEPE
jgi:phage-related protein (TIGR01555 family)